MDDSQSGLIGLGDRVAEVQDRLRQAHGHVELGRRSLNDALVSGQAFAGLRARRRKARLSSIAVALALVLVAFLAVVCVGWLARRRGSTGSGAWLGGASGIQPASGDRRWPTAPPAARRRAREPPGRARRCPCGPRTPRRRRRVRPGRRRPPAAGRCGSAVAASPRARGRPAGSAPRRRPRRRRRRTPTSARGTTPSSRRRPGAGREADVARRRRRQRAARRDDRLEGLAGARRGGPASGRSPADGRRGGAPARRSPRRARTEGRRRARAAAPGIGARRGRRVARCAAWRWRAPRTSAA